MSCRSSLRSGCRSPVGLAVLAAALLALVAVAGCGRKGPPLPPLREPDPIAETAPGEAAALDTGSAESGAPSDEDGEDDDSEDGKDDGDGEDGDSEDGDPKTSTDDDGAPP